ncbi:hypothetical protein AYL99_01960 [Fonsecaea erecta]|uniref:Uncharacterized protein n=1 Tax=Fonsecaea erecta TaxID=1367422 RepID=A0A178ZU37_9EURO|nr:hypothetical protein AYL99_01960 [Fonsecaea erecta]OAP62733.1 hypothetical protein AYL99_01960 [Fonsecaea erecta]
MAEAIAALSLASTILQVIDFGSKFVSTAWKIYDVGHRHLKGPDEVASLDVLSNNLSDVLRDILTQSRATGLANDGNRGIHTLSKECAILIEKLARSLDTLGLKDASRKRAAVVAAFKLAWKREEINALQARLNDFRSQLTLSLLVSVRYYASQSLIQQNAILNELQKAQGSTQAGSSAMNNNFKTSDPFGTSVLNYVTWKLNQSEQAETRRFLKTEIIRAIHDTAVSNSETHTSVMGTTVPDEADRRVRGMLLQSLYYDRMNDREERISEAHETTFQWLLMASDSDKWASFKDWLESDDKLYWITGKPGSGKSTLMKYICFPVQSAEESHPAPRCRKFLEMWSGDQHLVIASFYFWNSGTQTQMTQRGLLMSLLHQIFQQCPQLATLGCPDRWESLNLFGEYLAWEDQELRDTLCRVAKNLVQVDSTLTLFVDGLDEFQGKPEELILLFKTILNFSNIKICVASRPWVEFQDAFQHKPSLMLHDLTHDDIKSYIASKLHDEPMFAQLRRREEEFADRLIEDIVAKAAGVFLWVTLVVSSLIAGMSSGDRISDFKRRLDQLPPDLSELYEKILLSLDDFYLDHAAQLFSLVETSLVPMNLVLASFVDEDDPNLALRQPCRLLSEDETVLRMETMRRRINSRSKGLLEVKGPFSTSEGFKYEDPWDHNRYTVQYLHRTVKDYIESDKAQIILQRVARSPFDPPLKLLAGHVAYIKLLDLERVSALDFWNHNFKECLRLARLVSPDNIPKMVLLLDEMDKMDKVGRATFQALRGIVTLERRPDVEHLYWTFLESFQDEDVDKSAHRFRPLFLTLAVIFGVVEFVRVKAEAGCLISKPICCDTTAQVNDCGEWSLLMIAIQVAAQKFRSEFPASVKEFDFGFDPRHGMLQCLLEKSADPNYLFNHSPRRKTSPLIESVYQLMVFGTTSHALRRGDDSWVERHQFWVETTRLLGRAGRLDKSTVDRALALFLPTWPSYRLQTFVQWSHARKSLRQSLQTVVHGGDPDLSAILDKLIRLAERRGR